MTRKNDFLFITLAVVIAGFGTMYAQEQDGSSQAALTGKDYEQIRALYARYNQGSDFRDAELFLSAFAEDAVMTRGGRDYVGMDALRADRAERYQGQTGDVGRRHINGSFLLRATDEGASARTYYVLMDVAARPPAMIGSGYYQDDFVRSNQGWKIKHRTLFSDGSTQ
jgi:hypothetical protein